jgi:hypothetical protein
MSSSDKTHSQLYIQKHLDMNPGIPLFLFKLLLFLFFFLLMALFPRPVQAQQNRLVKVESGKRLAGQASYLPHWISGNELFPDFV